MRNAAGAALVCIALVTAARAAPIGPEKKVILWNRDPNTTFIREHIAEMEKAPFDGIILSARAQTDDGTIYLSHKNWGARRFTEDELRPAMEDLQATRFTRFTDNFLRLNATPGDVDWFDPEFGAVIENARMGGKLGKAGRLRGILLDVEMYGGPVFVYLGQKHAKEKTFEEYAARGRERGRQFIEAVQSEMDDPVVLITFGYSVVPQVQWDDLANAGTGLLPAFIDGLIEGARGGTQIVDAFESSYTYRNPQQFADARKKIRTAAARLSGLPDVRRRLGVGFGLWMEQGWPAVGWHPDDPEKNALSPIEFEYALHRALAQSDRYVWLYSDKSDWWTGANLPQAYVTAARNARKHHDPAWRTSREPPDPSMFTILSKAIGGANDDRTFGPLWDEYEDIMDLPKTWLFRLDPKRVGEKEKWYARDADTSQWKPIEIGKFWDEQGYRAHHGVAWYRLKVHIPDAIKGRRRLLAFGAADETVRLWVNGRYVDEWGILGYTWTQRFELDVTRFLRAGRENLIVVAVNNSMGQGGLWKPIKLIAPKGE